MRTHLKFRLRNGALQTTCEYIRFTETHIPVRELLQNTGNLLLLEKGHRTEQTQVIMTGADPYWLLLFDNGRNFVTAKPFESPCSAPVSFFVNQPYLVLIPGNTDIPLTEIQSFTFKF